MNSMLNDSNFEWAIVKQHKRIEKLEKQVMLLSKALLDLYGLGVIPDEYFKDLEDFVNE